MFPEWAVGVGVIIVAVFGGIGLMVRTLPSRMPKKARGQDADDLEDLHRKLDEVDELRRRLGEVEERLDFTERLLASQRDGDRLPPSTR